MTSYAQHERAALCDLMTEAGPDAPTLCEGWATRDLAAHLVLRERRPDAAGGILLPALAGYTQRVQDRIAAGTFAEVVERVRTGPPLPMRLLDEVVNTVEYFVHLEDVRRARPDWEPRRLDIGFEDLLWRRLKVGARVLFRRSPVGVTLVRAGGDTVAARQATPMVTVTGPASELTLFAFGRGDYARVELTGDPDAVARLREARLGP